MTIQTEDFCVFGNTTTITYNFNTMRKNVTINGISAELPFTMAESIAELTKPTETTSWGYSNKKTIL